MSINLAVSKLFFSAKERKDFYQLCADYLGQGQSLSKLVGSYRRRYEKDGNLLKAVFEELETKLNTGSRYSDAFAQILPKDELGMIACVDRSQISDVQRVFLILVNQLEKKISISQSMFGLNTIFIFLVILFGPLVINSMSGVYVEVSDRLLRMVNIYTLNSYSAWVITKFQPFMADRFYMIYFVVLVFLSISWALVIYVPPSIARMKIEKIGLFFPFYLYARYKSFLFLLSAGAFSDANYSISDYARVMSKLSKNYEHKVYDAISHRLSSGHFSDGEALMIGWLPKEIEYRLEDYAQSDDFGTATFRIAEQTIVSVKKSIERVISMCLYSALGMFIWALFSIILSNQFLTQSI
ncbi:hypothetical protein [Reinekea sp. G2M2-21]|uniref:hypothetical protein n=1 Tax=Reinekea sp. G2M2-21 TaxID=2788942 RepID=UPI0018AA4083|nr:hypothetical protein [Reinekea sp. G2M2-21]